MTVREFAEKAAQLINEMGREGLSARVDTRQKPEGLLTGVTLVSEAHPDIQPSYYVDDAFRHNAPVEEFVGEILDHYTNAIENGEAEHVMDLIPKDISNFESVKDRVFPTLMDKARTDYLKDKVYDEKDDLAIVYRIHLAPMYSIAITDDLMRSWNIFKEELRTTAYANFEKIEFQAVPLAENKAIAVFFGDRPFGAASMLCTELLQTLCAKKGWDKAFVLPESANEILLVEAEDITDAAYYREIVAGINECQVAPEDRLPNSVYLFDSDSATLELIPDDDKGREEPDLGR